MADSPNFQDFVKLDESSALAAIGGAAKIFSGGTGGQSLVMGNDPATSVGTLIWNPQTTRTISLPDANGVLALGSQTIAVGVSTGGNTAGNTGTTVGTLVLAGVGIVTLSQSTAAGSLATISISATQSTQPGVTAIGVSTGGNTSGNTGTTQGTYVLAGGNQITLSQATAAGSLATVTISGANAIFGAGVSTGGNTSGTTGTVTGTLVLAGGNNVTLSQSTNATGATITISAANSATVVSGIGVSTGGNTSGNTGTTVGTIVLAGGNNITLSQSTAAGSLATITVSGPNAIFGAGVSTGGNTSGTTGTVTGTLVLAGLGEITLSQSTNASGATVTISAPAGDLAIAAGSQTATSGTVIFSNSNNVTFGMSNSSIITATVENRLTNFVWPTEFQATFFTISNASLSLQKIYMPMHLTGTRMQVLMDLTGSSNSTGALTISVAVYTLTGSTASLASSGSRQISWSSGSATTVSTIYGGVSGTRYRTISLGLTMTPGDYLFAFNLQTTNNGTWRMFGPQAVSIVGALDANETNYYLNGSSASSTTAFPGSINVTDTNYVRTGLNALRQPGFILIGTF